MLQRFCYNTESSRSSNGQTSKKRRGRQKKNSEKLEPSVSFFRHLPLPFQNKPNESSDNTNSLKQIDHHYHSLTKDALGVECPIPYIHGAL